MDGLRGRLLLNRDFAPDLPNRVPDLHDREFYERDHSDPHPRLRPDGPGHGTGHRRHVALNARNRTLDSYRMATFTP